MGKVMGRTTTKHRDPFSAAWERELERISSRDKDKEKADKKRKERDPKSSSFDSGAVQLVERLTALPSETALEAAMPWVEEWLSSLFDKAHADPKATEYILGLDMAMHRLLMRKDRFSENQDLKDFVDAAMGHKPAAERLLSDYRNQRGQGGDPVGYASAWISYKLDSTADSSLSSNGRRGRKPSVDQFAKSLEIARGVLECKRSGISGDSAFEATGESWSLSGARVKTIYRKFRGLAQAWVDAEADWRQILGLLSRFSFRAD